MTPWYLVRYGGMVIVRQVPFKSHIGIVCLNLWEQDRLSSEYKTNDGLHIILYTHGFTFCRQRANGFLSLAVHKGQRIWTGCKFFRKVVVYVSSTVSGAWGNEDEASRFHES